MADIAYPHLFEPIRIGAVEIRNRLYMTAHGLGYAVPDPEMPGYSIPSDRHIAYYEERARGGIGLIIQESTVPHPSSQGSAFGYQTATVAAAFAEKNIPHFARVADAVHRHGARLFIQLWHGGHHADPRWHPGGPRRPLISASDVPAVEAYSIPRAASLEEIRSIIDGFAQSARNAKAAGYDGVEIQGAHSALIEQFLSPFYNKRQDAYGGSPENRLRFALELLEAVRGAVGPEMAVGFRLNTDELLPGGLGEEECADIVRRLDETGRVDFLDLDIGTMHTAPLMIAASFVPKLPAEDFIAAIRPAIKRAAMLGCPGRLVDPADAERLIAEGKMDMVGAARAHIAEPEFARWAKAGRPDKIRPCIACNHCLEGILSGVACVINPATGREAAWGTQHIDPASTRKRVVVVGGGLAGMEAARIAALRGHEVRLMERHPRLGGALNLMAELPGRDVVAEVPRWYERELQALGVERQLNQEATAESILATHPDAVILATGARFERTGITGFIAESIPGWDRPFVYTPEQVLESKIDCGDRVVILDEEGQSTAVGLAEKLATEGAKVDIVTRWQLVAPRLQANGQFAWVLTRLYANGVTLRPNHYIKRIGDRTVTLFNIFSNEELEIEDISAVLLVGSKRPDGDLAGALRGRVAELHVIGDAATPRTLFEAGYEAQTAARLL
jgi:2,4-dienoyl-CoA reductase-like NADH-dependent reductase (Old Yellow Enzyme family)/thioredoxin reductase